MCGLAGLFAYADSAPPVEEAELLRMRERMITRGPDGAGLWLSEHHRVGFAHRRLAIIDLSDKAAQPMASACGRYRIVFNGEIYNHCELRARLEQQGVVFRTESDTEVLLALYAHRGRAMCDELRGMYAFVIWDTRDHSLFLARDPFGIKPLYVHDDGRTLRFASQVKALLIGGAVGPARSMEGEEGYWVWGSVPEPHTLYENLRALEPGTWLQIDRDGRRVVGRFDSVEQMLVGEAPVAYPNLREALLDSVRAHLVADVSVGVFLSAGIDSAALTALAAECGHADGGRLKTITLGFEEYRGTPADETVLAEQVARQCGTDHRTVWVGREAFVDAFEQFLSDMDQPSIDGLNTWLVARAASEAGLKVALSGLGGDEFFGGYPSFRQLPWLRTLTAPFAGMPGLGRGLRRLTLPIVRRVTSEKYAGLFEYGGSWGGAYLLRRALRMPWELPGPTAPLLPRMPATLSAASGGSLAAVSYLESTQYMRNQLLRDADWAGMAHSVEIRVPLVDAPLVRELAARRRVGERIGKRELAASARPALPDTLVSRAKTGFTVPVRDWMQAAGAAQAGRGLRAWQRTVFERAASVRVAA